MTPDPATTALADQPWLRDYLEERGFEPGTPGTFSNGRGKLRFEGATLRASSIAAGGTTWNSDLRGATPDGVRTLLDVLLASEPFLAPSEIQRRTEQNSLAAQALNCIAATIREDPHSPMSVHLRRWLWSLFNGNHALNLWRLRDVLDARHTECLRQVFNAWIDRQLSPDALRDALMSSGEMDLWETVRLGAAHERRLADAIDAVTDLLNAVPPGAPTRELTRANGLLRQVMDCLSITRRNRE